MKATPLTLFPLALVILFYGCASDGDPSKEQVERGRDGTIAYLVQVESSEPGVKIEADGDLVGTTPCTLKIFGDRDGTFHNFGSYTYVVRAIPAQPGQYEQVKTFRTGGWFTPEDRIPKRIYFEMGMSRAPVQQQQQQRQPGATLHEPQVALSFSEASIHQDPPPGVELRLYGGRGHDVFLGCLTCSKEDPKSIWNKFGDYGSQVNPNSIWNMVGTFGSDVSDQSPWCIIGQHPPVVVDPDGNFYGYFTANETNLKRTRIKSLLRILLSRDSIRRNFDAYVDTLE